MNRSPHEIIRASAGTGKTYQLVNRYLRLAFGTQAPERILALTFTRKAAGEFFDKIFHRLAKAAESEDAAGELGADLGITLTRKQTLDMLRLLLDRLNRLQLSTYDSFFARIVQAFPFELGLSAPPSPMTKAQEQEALLRAQAILLEVGDDENALQDFWHAFKRASMGRDEKRMSELLDDFIQNTQGLYLEAPDPELWGNTARIWPRGCPWVADKLVPAQLAQELRAALVWSDMKPKQKEDWELFLEDLGSWQPPSEASDRVRKFAAKFLEILADLRARSATITVRRSQVLGAEECRLAEAIAVFFFWNEVAPRIEATKGLYDMVRLFEAVYREEVRRLGQLTIGDMTHLLAGDAVGGEGLGGDTLRMALDYRLDSSFDHWLLDEFQDTSHAQWHAVENLADEILQDESGRRSFFAVGDTKQSLYMWRGSDDRLFDRILNRYGEVLHLRRLNESYRSAPPVLEMVNAVFGAKIALTEIVGEELSARWERMWGEHKSAKPVGRLSGHACWLLTPESDEERRASLLALLRDLKPLERGLSVAILTQTNREAEDLVDYLRANSDLPCSLAAEVRPGADNPASVSLRSLASLAAHPSDKLAWVQLMMTPLADRLRADGDTPDLLSQHLRACVAKGGMQALVEYWSALVLPVLDEADAFTRDRLARCLDIARAVDERGALDLDNFIRELDGNTLRETDVPGQVAVMTIHKSKGLDWDIVLLPDLEGNSLTERRQGLAVRKDSDGEIQWVLQMPRKEIALADESLGAQILEAEQDAAFGQLCLLYVAMTRAKRGLYILTDDPSESSSRNFPKLLATALGINLCELVRGELRLPVAWQAGDPHWIDALPLETKKAAPSVPQTPLKLPPTPTQPAQAQPVEIPSKAGHSGDVQVDKLWDQESVNRSAGVLLHQLISKLGWVEDSVPNSAELSTRADSEAAREAAQVLHASLSHGEISSLLCQRNPKDRLWREQDFEVFAEGRWLRGRLDRVQIRCAEDGSISSVELLDFKTTASREPALFKAQLFAYRRALVKLLGVDETRIRCFVVFLSSENPGILELR